MTTINLPENVQSIFHSFDVVNRRTGFTMRLIQIGETPDDAARTIRQYNLATLDFENDYELRLVGDERREAIKNFMAEYSNPASDESELVATAYRLGITTADIQREREREGKAAVSRF